MSDPGLQDAANGGSEERHITVAGEDWTVRGGGVGLAGTGRAGLAPLEAVHFYRGNEDRPRYEALIARGRWRELYPGELAALLATASPVPPAG